MKLNLSQDRGIQLLSATGAVESSDVRVFGAGMGKLIRDGKNQLAVEMDQENIPDDLIRELMTLDLVARELSGRLVVIALQSALKTKLENFARPMSLEVFSDRTSALDFFEKVNSAPLGPISGSQPEQSAEAAKEDALTAAPATPSAPATAPSGPPPEEQIKQLKEDIRQRELKELGQLRETISRLENENKALLDQFRTYFRDRRTPPDERAYQQRITDLEARIEELMTEMGKEMAK
ncbi:MAG: hypothetical protein KGQ59_10155 [Bdellovibrionales bacterium]|nr:hypothetical protein [Bdellovibrionales bacterium]